MFISFPALPTNGIPSLSSSAPGPSPINIKSAVLFPSPKTILFLLLHSLHLLQLIILCSNSSHVSYIFFSYYLKNVSTFPLPSFEVIFKIAPFTIASCGGTCPISAPHIT